MSPALRPYLAFFVAGLLLILGAAGLSVWQSAPNPARAVPGVSGDVDHGLAGPRIVDHEQGPAVTRYAQACEAAMQARFAPEQIKQESQIAQCADLGVTAPESLGVIGALATFSAYDGETLHVQVSVATEAATWRFLDGRLLGVSDY